MTFFLSAVLDNLTTTIVMVALIQKLLRTHEQKMLIGGAIVIAANAGGAWSPIGDVTTTMLWIGGNVSTWPLMRDLFLPSMACSLVAFAWLHFYLPELPVIDKGTEEAFPFPKLGNILFFLGIGSLVFVPVLRYLTGMPPFMGVILGLGLMWLVTDLVHRNYHHHVHLTMPAALSRIDMSGVLFFLGILLSIQALETVGVLDHLALVLQHFIGNINMIAVAIGILSAVIDNVPLVAGSMGMYNLSAYPTDSSFWQLVAYCAGTGGSMLIIGSAAGVAFMGMEKVGFGWYLKKIGPPAAVGYFAGIIVYLLIH
jgi:Na+/H+ antiporter NhaD/arsenite permease-like protein